MIDDAERREVARRLRECTPPTNYRHSQGGGWAHLCDMALAVGFTREDNPTAWEFARRLADLIEPSEPKVKCVAEVKVDGERLEKLTHDAAVELTGIDRDALLALADEIWENADISRELHGEMLKEKRLDMALTFHEYALELREYTDRILDALGVKS